MLTADQELLLQIEEHPFDDDLRLELAAHRLGQFPKNDPRALLIKEQLASEPDHDLIERLLAEHGRTLAAADLGITPDDIPDGATCEFHKGFAWWPLRATYENFAAAIAAGRYNGIYPYIIAKKLPYITARHIGLEDAPVVIDAKVVLYAPHQLVTSQAAVQHLHRRLRLHVDQDQVWELCAFGANHPGIQRQFPIAALGSACVGPGGRRDVPFLSLWDAERVLGLKGWDAGWDPPFRFLAARPRLSNHWTRILRHQVR